MLSDRDFERWLAANDFPPSARDIINQVRASPPSRRVDPCRTGVACRYPSRKMGAIIQAAGHRIRLPAIYEYEHDAEVLEFYDQPPPIKLCYRSRKGRQTACLYTPDYFVLRVASAGWEEWRAADSLRRLCRRMPFRYVHLEGEGWGNLPGAEHARSHGLFYRVRCDSEVNWIVQRNRVFLEDYYRKPSSPPPEACDEVSGLLERNPMGMPLSVLLASLRIATSDSVYALIACQGIYVDLQAVPLAEPDRVLVFRDADSAVAAAIVADDATCLPPPGCMPATVPQELPREVHERLRRAGPAAIARANDRYEIIRPHLEGVPSRDHDGASPRTLRRWLAAFRSAQRQCGCGYVALLDRTSARGNRTPRLAPEVTAVIKEVVAATDEESQPIIADLHKSVVDACKARGLDAPSYRTVRLAVPRARSGVSEDPDAEHRNHAGTFYWELDQATPRHGDRPFEIGHIDHTELDVELVCARTGRPLGRPWVTFFSDAFSRRILALLLLYDPPSYRTLMGIIRCCVARQGRLPQIIVVDGGKEFGSVYMESLLAFYEITKKTRPPRKPRFGSVIERLFGTANTQFVHRLLGSTVSSRGEPCWTIAALDRRLQQWAYEVYDTADHPVLGESPRECFDRVRQRTGERQRRSIAYDDAFLLATLPSTPRGDAKVDPRRGVKIRNVWYWTDAFSDRSVGNQRVPVRYDPHDAGRAFAFVRGRWVRLISEHHVTLQGRSEREILLATAELRQRHLLHGRRLHRPVRPEAAMR